MINFSDETSIWRKRIYLRTACKKKKTKKYWIWSTTNSFTIVTVLYFPLPFPRNLETSKNSKTPATMILISKNKNTRRKLASCVNTYKCISVSSENKRLFASKVHNDGRRISFEISFTLHFTIAVYARSQTEILKSFASVNCATYVVRTRARNMPLRLLRFALSDIQATFCFLVHSRNTTDHSLGIRSFTRSCQETLPRKRPLFVERSLRSCLTILCSRSFVTYRRSRRQWLFKYYRKCGYNYHIR